METLIRDPYAIYANRVLRLRALDPLRAGADARLRGTILHRVLHEFIDETRAGLPPPDIARARLMALTDAALDEAAPFPAIRHIWRARMDRVADFFLRTEAQRRQRGTPVLLEHAGQWEVPGTGVTLTVKADRIDRLHDGRHAIFDYKTGAPPTDKEERHFNRQLWIEALMLQAGALGLPAGSALAELAYIGLGGTPDIAARDADPAVMAQMAADLHRRLTLMLDRDQGFPARRSVRDTRFAGDYDQLARHGEWDETATPVLIRVGQGGTP
jgi:RecB family exonuclease